MIAEHENADHIRERARLTREAHTRGEALALRYARAQRDHHGRVVLRNAAVRVEVVASDEHGATVSIDGVHLVARWCELAPLSTIDCALASPREARRLAESMRGDITIRGGGR